MSLDNEIDVVGSELIKVTLNGDSATRLLVGNLVNFLASKGIINRDEYLDYVEETKRGLIESASIEDEDRSEMIKNVFDLHLNDFKK